MAIRSSAVMGISGLINEVQVKSELLAVHLAAFNLHCWPEWEADVTSRMEQAREAEDTASLQLLLAVIQDALQKSLWQLDQVTASDLKPTFLPFYFICSSGIFPKTFS